MQRNDYERQSISRYCKYEYYGQLCYLNYYVGTVAAEAGAGFVRQCFSAAGGNRLVHFAGPASVEVREGIIAVLKIKLGAQQFF